MKLGRTLLSTKCINGYDPHYPGRKLNSGRSATAGLLWFKTGRSARNKTISGVLPVKSFLLFSTVVFGNVHTWIYTLTRFSFISLNYFL